MPRVCSAVRFAPAVDRRVDTAGARCRRPIIRRCLPVIRRRPPVARSNTPPARRGSRTGRIVRTFGTVQHCWIDALPLFGPSKWYRSVWCAHAPEATRRTDSRRRIAFIAVRRSYLMRLLPDAAMTYTARLPRAERVDTGRRVNSATTFEIAAPSGSSPRRTAKGSSSWSPMSLRSGTAVDMPVATNCSVKGAGCSTALTKRKIRPDLRGGSRTLSPFYPSVGFRVDNQSGTGQSGVPMRRKLPGRPNPDGGLR